VLDGNHPRVREDLLRKIVDQLPLNIKTSN
jgi:hypothetical protein